MDYNYHTHTYRCSHAVGEDEDYIRSAIASGIKRMGFSDHISLVLPDGSESWFRVPARQVNEYFSTLRALAEKYKNEIEIKVGFEAEYYPEFFEQMLEMSKEVGADYMILGQHYLKAECFAPDDHSTTLSDDEKRLCDYVSTVLEAMKTGAFSYVAHPDIIAFTGDKEIYDREMKKIAELSLELDIPLEINLLGIREDRRYPCERFWEIAGQVGAPVTFGLDAHTPEDAGSLEAVKIAEEICRKYGLNYIGEPHLIPLK